MSDYDWTTAMRVRLETERDAIRADLARAEAQVATLREALDELADIVQGHLDDGDKLDSFTLRPARAALAATKPKGGKL